MNHLKLFRESASEYDPKKDLDNIIDSLYPIIDDHIVDVVLKLQYFSKTSNQYEYLDMGYSDYSNKNRAYQNFISELQKTNPVFRITICLSFEKSSYREWSSAINDMSIVLDSLKEFGWSLIEISTGDIRRYANDPPRSLPILPKFFNYNIYRHSPTPLSK